MEPKKKDINVDGRSIKEEIERRKKTYQSTYPQYAPERALSGCKVNLILAKKYEDHDGMVSGAVFFPKHSKFATSSRDGSIRIYDIQTAACLSVCRVTLRGLRNVRIGNMTFYVRKIVRWDDDIFVAASDSSQIEFYSIVNESLIKTIDYPTDRVLRPYNERYVNTYDILKLNEKQLLSITNEGFFIHTFATEICDRIWEGNIDLGKSGGTSILVSSKGRKDTVIYKNSSLDEKIAVIELREPTCNFEYINVDMGVRNYLFDTYLNSNNEEIIICGGRTKTLNFLHLENSIKEDRPVFVRSVRLDNPIHSLVRVNKWVLVGDSWGFVCCVDVSKGANMSVELKKKIHDAAINHIEPVKIGRTLRFITCSNDKTFGVVISKNISSVDYLEGLEVQDLRERVSFLVEEVDEWGCIPQLESSTEDERNDVNIDILRIGMHNMTLNFVSKFWLLQ